jgi:hypothetical protein
MANTDEAFEMARDLFDDWQVENRGWNVHSNKTLKEWMEKSRGNFIMHWKESQAYSRMLWFLAIPTLVLGAFVGVEGLESALLSDDLSTTERVLRAASSLLTMVVAALANVLAFVDPKSKEAAFREAANEFSALSARLRFEHDRDWNHRTPHAILMRSVMDQMSEIKKKTPLLSEKSIRAYQTAVGAGGDTTYLPDIMVPIGRMGDDRDPGFSWVTGTQRRRYPREGEGPGRSKPSALMHMAAIRRLAQEGRVKPESKEPPIVAEEGGNAPSREYDPHSDEEHGRQSSGSPSSPPYDPHNDEEHGRQPSGSSPSSPLGSPNGSIASTGHATRAGVDHLLFG